jgi:serine/threonine protein kinase
MSPEDEEDERSRFPARPERVVIIYEPFARATFFETLMNQSQSLKLSAFVQLLDGLSALHSAGFMHRDIKLANLGVVSISSTAIEIVILDYGQTIQATTCQPKPGTVGTIPYIAPEMETSAYGHGVDIWASGIVGLQLFVTDGKTQWMQITHEKARYTRWMKSLGMKPSGSIESLLLEMLSWDPIERPSAAIAQNHPCFLGLAAANSLKNELEVGGKRSALNSVWADGQRLKRSTADSVQPP